jgi:hypothetical protein
MKQGESAHENSSNVDPRFRKGIEQFNDREFFECHEVLEALWNDQSEPEKQLTQGILQIAVGYYHYLRGNYEGTRRLFRRGLPRVKLFCENPDCCVLIDPFIATVEDGLRILEANLLATPNPQAPVLGAHPPNEPFAEIQIPKMSFR